ncbi:MAG: hypothetical protein WC136_01770 [Sphaerochaeta sp.]|jgi:hypothetical protein
MNIRSTDAMPKEIDFAADFVIENQALYNEMFNLLKNIITKLNQDSMSNSSFCSVIKTPEGVTKPLLKIFNLTDRQMLDAFEKIGFVKNSRMYSNLYYQALSLVYYIGVKKQDAVLRQYAIALIYIKLFNGRKYKWMPNGCQEEIAQYMMTNVLRESHTFKKYPNPFLAIVSSLTPTLDAKYYSYVKDHPADQNHGLISILKNGWNRMDQIFRGIKDHYYEAYRNHDKILLSSQNNQYASDMVEVSEEVIHKLIDKIQKTSMVNTNKLTFEDKAFLKQSYFVSETFLDKIEHTLNDMDDDVRNVYELLFSVMKVNESNICNTHITSSAAKISGAKGNDQRILKLKQYVDSILNSTYRGILASSSDSQKLKLRKIIILMILLKGKKAFCSNAKFETSF